MEIERKYLIPKLPDGYMDYPKKEIEQGWKQQQQLVSYRVFWAGIGAVGVPGSWYAKSTTFR